MLDDTPQYQDRKRSRDLSDRDNEGRIRVLVGELKDEAERRVSLRKSIEERWISDLQLYHGVYDNDTQARLKSNKVQSRIFINQTRPKTDAMSARLMDLLFPTDDKNWGIQPTPVPELADGQDEMRDRLKQADDMLAGADAVGTDEQFAEGSPELQAAEVKAAEATEMMSEAQAALDQLEDVISKATKASNLMQEEISDQLKACRYQAQCRNAIDQACKIGTGVMKGPILSGKTRRKWQMTENGFELEHVSDDRPSYRWVDAWAFFPDPDYRDHVEGNGVYERQLLSKSGLRALAKSQDIDPAAVARLIKEEPSATATPTHMSLLYSITRDEAHKISDRYHVWEYTGPIEPEQMLSLAEGYEDGNMIDAMSDADALEQTFARITFCQDEILSFALHPMDSGETLYSVFNLHEDETSPFGYGIPHIVSSPQKALNAAWRMMMDNARISAGPQVIVNKDVIEPEDNTYELTPNKIWKRKTGTGNAPAFETYNITMNQPMLQSVIEMSGYFIDQTSGMPQIAQGEQGASVTKTFQGMAILMNSANVVFGRIVKSFDDNITTPNIRRMYDFNMQFSAKDELKGDFEIDARGSSTLLVREMQQNNLMLFAQSFGDHPEFGAWIKKPELLSQICRAMSLTTGELISTKDEHAAIIAEQAEKQTPDPMVQVRADEIELKREEIEARMAISEQESHARKQVAELNFRAAMMKVTEDLNQKEADREMRQLSDEANIQHSERKLATEVAMAQKTGNHAGGSI